MRAASALALRVSPLTPGPVPKHAGCKLEPVSRNDGSGHPPKRQESERRPAPPALHVRGIPRAEGEIGKRGCPRARSPTLPAVAVAPVDPAAAVPIEAPGPAPAVGVPAEVALAPQPPALRRPLQEGGHVRPGQAPGAELRHVDEAPAAAGAAAGGLLVLERQRRARRREAEAPQDEGRRGGPRPAERPEDRRQEDAGACHSARLARSFLWSIAPRLSNPGCERGGRAGPRRAANPRAAPTPARGGAGAPKGVGGGGSTAGLGVQREALLGSGLPPLLPPPPVRGPCLGRAPESE